MDLSFDSVISHAAAGRERLGVESVDVVMAHAPDPDTPAEETLRGFGSLIDDGRASGWGSSNIDGPTLTEWLDTARRLGLPAPAFVENRYNLLQREDEETVLPVCREKEIRFLAYSPTASGLLTGKYRKGEPPPVGSMMALRPDLASDFDARAARLIAAVTDVALAHRVANVAVAVAWLMEQPAVIPIAGPSKSHHMDAVEQALELELTDTDFRRLSEGSLQEQVRLVGTCETTGHPLAASPPDGSTHTESLHARVANARRIRPRRLSREPKGHDP